MVAAQHHGDGPGGENFAHAQFDIGVALFGVGMNNIGVADIGDAAVTEIGGIVLMVVGAGMAEGK